MGYDQASRSCRPIPSLLPCALSVRGGDASLGQPLGGGARGGADCLFGEGGSPQGLPPWGDRRTLQRDRVALAPAQARRWQISRDWRRAGLILPGQGRPIGRTCGRRPHPTLTAGLCNVPSPGAARHPLELSLCSVRARRRRLARPTTGRRGEGRCRLMAWSANRASLGAPPNEAEMPRSATAERDSASGHLHPSSGQARGPSPVPPPFDRRSQGLLT